jgi:hypothetical protein
MNRLPFTISTEYPSGFGTMQFTAYTSPTAGLYAATEDTGGHPKNFDWYPSGSDSLTLRVSHPQPETSGNNVDIPYPTTLGPIHGDWQDAANRYKQWLTTEGWLTSTDSVTEPEWPNSTGIIQSTTSYRREEWPAQYPTLSFSEVTSLVKGIQNELETAIGHQHRGWGPHGYPGVGDWWPPYEGVDSFDNMTTVLSEDDIPKIAFYGPTFLGEMSDRWQTDREEAMKWVAEDPNGSPYTSPTDIGELYETIITHPGLRNVVRKQVSQLFDNGVDAVHLDGIPWKLRQPCYGETHDHPPGTGRWYSTGVRALYADLLSTARAPNPEATISGEGTTDFLLPYQQIGQFRSVKAEFAEPKLRDRITGIIPLVPYVLEEFMTVQWQNGEDPVSTDFASKDMVRMFIGRELIWGGIPELQLFNEPGHPNHYDNLLDYLTRIGDARTTWANRFISNGRPLRTPTIDAETVTVEQESIPNPEIRTIWGTAWRAETCETALLITNPSPTQASSSLNLQEQPFKNDMPTDVLLYRVRNGQYEELESGTFTSLSAVSLNLSPTDIELLAVAPLSEQRQIALKHLIEAQSTVEKDAGDDAMLLTKTKRAF